MKTRKGRIMGSMRLSLWGVVVTVLSFFLFGCSLFNISPKIKGTITYDFEAGSDWYVFLDTDTDVTNGYAKRLIGSVTSPLSSISYEFDTSDLPAGSYYLLGANDFGAGNMDPDDPSVWEAKGWYGSLSSDPPGSANVTDLRAVYDFVLYPLD